MLAARGLACRRGKRLLFSGLDLQLEPGAITWLRGTNGSGKTSLLRILAGLSGPAAGSVERGAELLYIGHANALKDDLTLAEAVAFLAQLQGLDDAPRRARAALARLALQTRADALVHTLSQGQKRRGALARLALDDAPRMWVLDEPYDALDGDAVVLLTALITAHAARGGAVLLTSHQHLALADARQVDLQRWRAP